MGKSRTIVILGLGSYMDTKVIVDGLIGKDGIEIWTMNDWHGHYPNLKHPDKIFHVHDWLSNREDDDIFEVYNNSGAEIVTIKPFERLKNNKVFDIDKHVKIWTEDFFSNTCNFCLAMAIEQKPSKIFLVGVQMLSHDGHIGQLPQTRYGVRKAREQGIEVWSQFEDQWNSVDPESDIKELPKLKAPYIFNKAGLQRWRDAGLAVWENPDEVKEI